MNEAKKLHVLAGVVSRFFRHESREDLIREILETAIEVTGADRGSLFLSPISEGKRHAHVLTTLVATGLDGKSITLPDNRGVAGHCYSTQTPVLVNDVSKDKRFCKDVDETFGYLTKSLVCVPLQTMTGKKLGALEILNKKNPSESFDQSDVEVLQVLGLFAAVALEKNLELHSLKEQKRFLIEEKRQRYRLIEEEQFLTTQYADLREVFQQLPHFAESESTVLISGESGTGKELVAHYLHRHSPRADAPFVAINCAAIPESLFEAELFGVAKGAATGTEERKGKLDMADGGTLFLDEIGELPMAVQAKILRALQEKTITPVGSPDHPHEVNFRLVAATNRNLKEMIAENTFREDLYYRLSVLNITLPPLRDRLNDLPLICENICRHMEHSRGWRPKQLSPQAVEKLKHYSWPGNIRELQNRLEGAYILTHKTTLIGPEAFPIEENYLPEETTPVPRVGALANVIPFDRTLRDAREEFERQFVMEVLKSCDFNKTHTAHKLGITREALRKILKRLNVAS